MHLSGNRLGERTFFLEAMGHLVLKCCIFLVTFSLIEATYYTTESLCQAKYMNRQRTLKVIDRQLEFLWYDLEQQIPVAQNAIVAARKFSNKKLWSVISAVVAGNIIRLAGRNVADVSYNEADVFDVAGRSLYSISFMTTRASNIVPVEIPCGRRQLIPVLKKFSYLRFFEDLQQKLFNVSTNAHPLQQLGPELLPEVLSLKLDEFKLRAKVALGCLFEDGVSEASRLSRSIDLIASATSRKLRILSSILQDKLDDIGSKSSEHKCLQY